jgi:hypothetical protein
MEYASLLTGMKEGNSLENSVVLAELILSWQRNVLLS